MLIKLYPSMVTWHVAGFANPIPPPHHEINWLLDGVPERCV